MGVVGFFPIPFFPPQVNQICPPSPPNARSRGGKSFSEPSLRPLMASFAPLGLKSGKLADLKASGENGAMTTSKALSVASYSSVTDYHQNKTDTTFLEAFLQKCRTLLGKNTSHHPKPLAYVHAHSSYSIPNRCLKCLFGYCVLAMV